MKISLLPAALAALAMPLKLACTAQQRFRPFEKRESFALQKTRWRRLAMQTTEFRFVGEQVQLTGSSRHE